MSDHIFVALVKIRDNMRLLPDPWEAVLQEVLDYAWDDELRHYQETLATDEDLELDDEQAVEHTRGFVTKAICDTHGSMPNVEERMVRVNDAGVFTCWACSEKEED